jgi:hypothetical protein
MAPLQRARPFWGYAGGSGQGWVQSARGGGRGEAGAAGVVEAAEAHAQARVAGARDGRGQPFGAAQLAGGGRAAVHDGHSARARGILGARAQAAALEEGRQARELEPVARAAVEVHGSRDRREGRGAAQPNPSRAKTRGRMERLISSELDRGTGGALEASKPACR